MSDPRVEYVEHSALVAHTPDGAFAFDPVRPVPADVVVVSHSHLDHFSPEVLRRFDRDVTVVVPRIAHPWKKSPSSAAYELERFRPSGDGDLERYGALLERALAELEAASRTPRGRESERQRRRVRFLKETWDGLGADLRRAWIGSIADGGADPRLSGYVAPKQLGFVERPDNPDLAEELRTLGFRRVIELPPWGEHRRGASTLVRVPANFAHGVTEQATFLLESGAFTLFDGVDAIEDEAVHSFVGRTWSVDVAFLPVSGRRFMHASPWAYRHTMDVAGAAKVARLLDARCVIPFRDDLDDHDRRAELLRLAPRCRILEPGGTWRPGDGPTPWTPEGAPAVPDDRLDRMAGAVGEVFGTEDFSVFLRSLVRLEVPRTIVELGTGLGLTAFRLAQAARENRAGHVWSVDDHRAGGGLPAAVERLRAAGFALAGRSPAEYLEEMRAHLGLEGFLTFVTSTVDLGEPDPFASLPFASLPIDLVFSDFGHGPREVARLLETLLPRMAPHASIFIHSASTYRPTRKFLEEELKRRNSDSRRYTLVHLAEKKARPQAGAAWIRIEPADGSPPPGVLMREE